MKVDLVPLETVKPYGRNPRKNEAAVAKVPASIREFGFRQPIVVDANMVVIAGHTRLLAAKQLRLKQVPVHVARELTAEQIKAYRIADNRTAEDSEWHDELLRIELGDLDAAGFDVSLTGFDLQEINELLVRELWPGHTDPDEVPAAPAEPVTRPGDLWILGDEKNGHRLLCGDSAAAPDLDRLLAGAPAHLLNTDPPYNVKVEPRSNNAIAAGLSSFTSQKKMHHQKLDLARHPSKSRPTGKMRAKDRPLTNDFASDAAFRKLLLAWFWNAARVLAPGRSFYVWGGYSNCVNIPLALGTVGLYLSQAIIWVRVGTTSGRVDVIPPSRTLFRVRSCSQGGRVRWVNERRNGRDAGDA
ncbi:MAG: ParB N-terminal domain-containing protein [Candidatus Binatia bacterium]